MQQPEQKTAAMMKYPVWNFCKLSELALDAFMGTLSTAKAFLLLYNHTRLVEFEKVGGCLEKSTARLAEDYVCQLLNDKFDLKWGEVMMEAAPEYLNAVKSQLLNHLLDSSGTVLSAICKVTPKQVVSNLCTLHQDYSVFNYMEIPHTSWTEVWIGTRHSLDVDGMLGC